METRDESKDYELFGILKSIDLRFDEASMKKELNKLKNAHKLFHPKDNLKQEMKRNINGLNSILSAFSRIDEEILKKDFEQIKASIEEIFRLYKMTTGIHETVKVKAKKMVINSLSDLDLLKDKVFEITEGEEDKKNEYNFLTRMTEECSKELDGRDLVFLNIPLLVNGWSENLDVLPYLGIHISNTKYGNLWSNQYIVAVSKSNLLDVSQLEKDIKLKYGQPFDFLFAPVSHRRFPNYVFHWAIPKKVMANLITLKVTNFSLPFENNISSSAWDADKIRKLRQQRIDWEKDNKKGKRNGKNH